MKLYIPIELLNESGRRALSSTPWRVVDEFTYIRQESTVDYSGITVVVTHHNATLHPSPLRWVLETTRDVEELLLLAELASREGGCDLAEMYLRNREVFQLDVVKKKLAELKNSELPIQSYRPVGSRVH